MTSVRRRLGLGAALAVAAALLTGCSPPDDAAPAPTSPSASEGVESEGSGIVPERAAATTTLRAGAIELLLTVPVEEEGDAGGGAREADGDGPAVHGDGQSAESDRASAESDEKATEGDGPAAEGDRASAEGDGPGESPAGSPTIVTADEDGSSRVTFVVPVEGSTVRGGATGSASSGAGGAASTPSGAKSSDTTTGGDASSSGEAVGGPTTGVPAAIPATIDLVSPADGSFLRNGDGSLTVLDAAGTPLGGLSAPKATDATGSAGRAGVAVVAPTRAEVHVKGGGATSSGATGETAGWTVTTWLGAQGVRSATWGEREGGRSLAVDATPWARQSGTVGTATAWAQLVASEPEADSRTMRDQFDCHVLGAPDKATWNLEPWRPDVGFLAMAAARCNPT